MFPHPVRMRCTPTARSNFTRLLCAGREICRIFANFVSEHFTRDVRTVAIILIGLFACLFCGSAKECAHARPAGPSDARIFGIGDSDSRIAVRSGCAEEWLCERQFNSDLNLPRILSEVGPAPAVPASLRSGRCFQYPRIAGGASAGCGGVKTTRKFNSENLSVGVCAIDYYVYRLRRLII